VGIREGGSRPPGGEEGVVFRGRGGGGVRRYGGMRAPRRGLVWFRSLRDAAGERERRGRLGVGHGRALTLWGLAVVVVLGVCSQEPEGWGPWLFVGGGGQGGVGGGQSERRRGGWGSGSRGEGRIGQPPIKKDSLAKTWGPVDAGGRGGGGGGGWEGGDG